MANAIRISAKNLGQVALPGFCPRCFWLRLRLGFNLPFQMFPGIFSSIDSYTKRVIHGWFDQHGSPPPWLESLGDLIGYQEPPHHSRFSILDPETNILLTGDPDGVFIRPDQSRLIVDYKTAKYTPTQDGLYPVYEAQLNGYALIGEQSHLVSPVSGLALIYAEPVTDQASASMQCNHGDMGFAMGFSVKVVDVPLNVSILRPLLARTREIYELKTIPPGRDACKDCQRLNVLLQVTGV